MSPSLQLRGRALVASEAGAEFKLRHISDSATFCLPIVSTGLPPPSPPPPPLRWEPPSRIGISWPASGAPAATNKLSAPLFATSSLSSTSYLFDSASFRALKLEPVLSDSARRDFRLDFHCDFHDATHRIASERGPQLAANCSPCLLPCARVRRYRSADLSESLKGSATCSTVRSESSVNLSPAAR